MITVNLFTSGKHTQPVIKALKEAKNIRLLNIFRKLPDPSDFPDNPDVFIIADFGQIIPPEILAIPKHGSLCVHPSLLPKYRGASPVQYAIMNGEKETGVTIFKMDEKVDHGPIIAQFKEEIRPNDTAESLYQRLFASGAQVLITILTAWVEGRIEPREQNHRQAIYTKMLTREDGKVDWQKSSEEIERFIRTMTLWPGAWCWVKIRGTVKRLKILKAHLEFPQILNTKYPARLASRPTSPVDEVAGGRARLEAGRQILILDEVQLEGKKPVNWKQFQEGYPEAKFA